MDTHETLGSMDDFERGWYHACITTLWWNTWSGDYTTEPQVVELRMPVELVEGKWLITAFSPSGSNVPAPSFYQEGQLADDAKKYYFDPKKFQAVWKELDYEASINYYRLRVEGGEFLTELIIQVASTESQHGLPDDWNIYPTDEDELIRNGQ